MSKMNKWNMMTSIFAAMAGIETGTGKAQENMKMEDLREWIFGWGSNNPRKNSNKRKGKMATKRRFKNKRRLAQVKMNRKRSK